jgi:hypothetical protein
MDFVVGVRLKQYHSFGLAPQALFHPIRMCHENQGMNASSMLDHQTDAEINLKGA